MIRYNNPTSYSNDWDSFFADPFRAFAPLLVNRATSAHQHPNSGVEWYEDDESFHARIELPGVAKEQLQLDAEDGLVRIGFTKEIRRGEVVDTESFERHLRTPEGTDLSGAEAKLENGILELTFPKAPERKPVTIRVS